MDLSLPLAFTVGLFSTLHCIGMCGGIMGALSYGLPSDVRSNWRSFAWFLLAYNVGRIASYVTAGALLGYAGAALIGSVTTSSGHLLLTWLAAAIMVAIGLHIAGWFPQFARLERLGAPLWRRLEPVGRRLLPVQSPLSAVAYGAVWGWLPCGLVYTMLVSASTQGDFVQGGMYMGAFGLGTLPSMMATGMLAGRLYRMSRQRYFREAVGLTVILLGLLTLVFQSTSGAPPVG